MAVENDMKSKYLKIQCYWNTHKNNETVPQCFWLSKIKKSV